MLLFLLEIIVSVVIFVIAFTQVIAPLWRGTKLFPKLRKQGQLESALDEARQSVVEAELNQKLTRVQQEAVRKTKKSDISSAQ